MPSLPGARRLTVSAAAGVTLLLAVLNAGTAHADPDPNLDSQISAADERLEQLVEERNAVQADLVGTQARVDGVTARIGELKAGLEEARRRVGLIAAAAYRIGPATGFSAALGTSPDEFLARLATLEALGAAERGQVSGLTDRLDRVRHEEAALRQLVQTRQEQQDSLTALTTQVEQDLARLRQQRRATVTVQVLPATPPPQVSGAAGVALAFAYAQIGKPYRYGAAGPDAYDCSGFTMASWQAAGVSLPHNAARQYGSLPHVSRDELAPGDLVFYYGDIHHVAMYVGDGMVIHAPSSGASVRVQSMDLAPIYGYGRPS